MAPPGVKEIRRRIFFALDEMKESGKVVKKPPNFAKFMPNNPSSQMHTMY